MPIRMKSSRGELTPDDVGDISALPDLLDQVGGDVASMTADGAYDGQVAYDAVAGRHPEAAGWLATEG